MQARQVSLDGSGIPDTEIVVGSATVEWDSIDQQWYVEVSDPDGDVWICPDNFDNKSDAQSLADDLNN